MGPIATAVGLRSSILRAHSTTPLHIDPCPCPLAPYVIRMRSLALGLASRAFTADDVMRLLGARGDPERGLVLSAVRAESEERFFEASIEIFERVDWASLGATERVDEGEVPTPPLLELFGDARGESATDHLAAREIVKLASLAEAPDACFASDLVRAFELDGLAAAARVRERVGKRLVMGPTRGMYHPPDDAVGALSIAECLRWLLGDSDESQLLAVADRGLGYGAYAAYVAQAIAFRRGLTLREDVVSLRHASRMCARIMYSVAHAIGPVFAQEMLTLLMDRGWHDDQGELTHGLGYAPLDRIVTSAAEQADLDVELHLYAYRDRGRGYVAELLARGANPNGYVDLLDKTTALHRAASSADCGEIVKRLLAAGADVHAVDAYGRTPLECVSRPTGEAALAAQRLAAAGAVCHDNGLYAAAELGLRQLVPALLRAGCDPSEERGGKTPYEVAVEARHMRTASAIAHGAEGRKSVRSDSAFRWPGSPRSERPGALGSSTSPATRSPPDRSGPRHA